MYISWHASFVGDSIDQVIVRAVLAGQLRAGTRLQETALAGLFEVSRTSVREALIRLETRGIVQSSPRRGWFVIEPSIEEAQEAFQARRAIERGILASLDRVDAAAICELRSHVAREREAIGSADVALRSFLLGDFHICLAEVLGNETLADILRDLTARTILISALYQSTHDAAGSCDEHERIIDLISAGDLHQATELMVQHIGNVEAGLTKRIDFDPLFDLRRALKPPTSNR
jgi:DNA-binding GntR family transcriptional regulator